MTALSAEESRSECLSQGHNAVAWIFFPGLVRYLNQGPLGYHQFSLEGDFCPDALTITPQRPHLKEKINSLINEQQQKLGHWLQTELSCVQYVVISARQTSVSDHT